MAGGSLTVRSSGGTPAVLPPSWLGGLWFGSRFGPGAVPVEAVTIWVSAVVAVFRVTEINGSKVFDEAKIDIIRKVRPWRVL